MPKRIQRKRTKGWKMHEGAIYVGRPTKWGNPFSFPPKLKSLNEEGQRLALQDMVNLYRKYLLEDAHLMASLHELRGKDLACWCALNRPCHADVLLEIAN